MRVFGGVLGVAVGLLVVVVLSSIATASTSGPAVSAAQSKPLGPFYNATFTETGLPSGTNWSVHVSYVGCACDGVHTTVSSTTSTIVIPITNGTYRYTALRVPGYYVVGSASGEVNVSGAPVGPIAFTFRPVVTYTVEFTETGLVSGTLWTVTVRGNGTGQLRALEDLTDSSTGSEMNFTLPNASYHYVASPVPGSFFFKGSNHGTFVVAGASPSPIQVTFVTPPTYALSFVETGLPTGTNWSVAVGGWGGVPIHETASSTSTTITFMLPNGSYRYVIAEVLGFVVNGSAFGKVSVTNAAVTVDVTFLALHKGAFYPVAFGENGLASGTHWAVTVWATHTFGHSRSETQSGNTTTLFFLLQNGTYRYVAHNVRGYTITAGGAGTFTIAGSSPSTIVVNYTVVPTYTMTFTETGLPGGTAWAVLVRSSSAGSTVYPIHIVQASNTTTMTFTIPNGSYCYRLYPVPGFRLTSGTAAGSFNVTGASPAGISFGFTAKG